MKIHYMPKLSSWYKLVVLLVVTIPLIALVTGMVLLWNSYFFLSDLLLFIGFMLVAGLGVTIGYHRMCTHQGFQTSSPMKALLLASGCMAWEGGPITWSATHIVHHACSDEEGDPHSPMEGFWHAHMGWLFRSDIEDPKVYASHLYADPVIVFIQRTWIIWAGLALVLPYLLGGWTGFLWGGLIRIAYTHHMTWSVNSICHTFGGRAFETTDASRNNWIVGILGFGEGWHNNHHAFPENAFHGMRWWQFDLSGILIRLMEATGLMWNVKRVSREAEEAHHARAEHSQTNLVTLREQLWANIGSAQKQVSETFWSTVERCTTLEQREALLARYNAACLQLQQLQDQARASTLLKRQRLQQQLSEVQSIALDLKDAAQRALGPVES